MTPRAALIAGFLAREGWGEAALAPLAGDASPRRYLRLSAPGRRAVLMDAPPGSGESVEPFVAVTGLLRARGLSAPEILAAEPAAGLLLLEDLGDDLFARICAADPRAEGPLYAAAVDLLAETLRPAPAVLPVYDVDTLLAEARLAPDWYAGALAPLSSASRAEFDALLTAAVAPAAGPPSALVHRDYHAENLLWLPDRAGHARIGLLDHQDARAGHPAYDLVSLLEDARRETPQDLREAMIARLLAARPELDPAEFRAAYAALGAQRNLKILGIFARLARRDGKPRYLALMPRVWAHLTRDLAHPALAPLAAWVRRHLAPPSDGTRARIAGERP